MVIESTSTKQWEVTFAILMRLKLTHDSEYITSLMHTNLRMRINQQTPAFVNNKYIYIHVHTVLITLHSN